MFPHVVECSGLFYIRRWNLGWEYFDSVDGRWSSIKWHGGHGTEEDAVEDYRSKSKFHKEKFKRFL